MSASNGNNEGPYRIGAIVMLVAMIVLVRFILFTRTFMIITKTTTAIIHRERLDDTQRVDHTAKLFGTYFPIRLESFVFDMARRLSHDYEGGLWHFYAMSNDGFYLAPELPETFNAESENGYQGVVTADALGITACLYAYSHLSFTDTGEFSNTCARQYHLLRDYVFEHHEAKHILGLID